MPTKRSPFPDLRVRLDGTEERAQRYQEEGLPVPTSQLRTEFEAAVRAGDVERADGVVKRAEALLARADQDWGWLSELLQRVDGLRGIADTVGLDLARIDARVGNPRAQLLAEPLTTTSLEKAAAGASFALAVLNDAIPKYVVTEAQALGVSIRRARDRGEDVREATVAFTSLLRALQEPVLTSTAERLVEARRAVARIPRAPSVAAVSDEEEDEILSEARNLARRLHRIKTRAHDATDAVRLISQVRQALSEDRDRRYVSPEEEVEALWAEVDRLTREKRLAAIGPPTEAEVPGDDDETYIGAGDSDEEDEPEEEVVAPRVPTGTTPIAELTFAQRAPPVAARPVSAPATPVARPAESRYPPPIVPPVRPLLDEQAGVKPAPSPDTLSEGAGPRVPRPTRIAIASAYVPPEISSGTILAAPVVSPRPASPPPAATPAPPKAEPAPVAVPTPAPIPPRAAPTPPPPAAPVPPAETPSTTQGVLPPPAPPTRRVRSRHRNT